MINRSVEVIDTPTYLIINNDLLVNFTFRDTNGNDAVQVSCEYTAATDDFGVVINKITPWPLSCQNKKVIVDKIFDECPFSSVTREDIETSMWQYSQEIERDEMS